MAADPFADFDRARDLDLPDAPDRKPLVAENS
jgi:hypothetical protein